VNDEIPIEATAGISGPPGSPGTPSVVSFPDDPDISLHLPADDVEAPELSIVIPALNEEAVIADFMAWCHEGIAEAGVAAEILILDSSDDRTPDIALAHGARVLKLPRRGLGRAYLDAIPHIRGRFVLMGDADCTYDFRRLKPFLEHFRAGASFVMGSRFAGSIEAGAMPALHRYFGTPLTTFILNFIYGSRFSDIHCGMRGITLDALKHMNLRSQSWEYASEMVVKSVRLGLETVEVPVHFYKDQPGRVSHHLRIGWFSPWHAGWINLRAMLVHGADYFVMKPGLLLLALGLLLTLPLAAGPLTVGGVTLSLNTMFLGAVLAVVGLQGLFLGCIAESLYDASGEARRRWLGIFSYTRTTIVCMLLFALGLMLCLNFVRAFADAGFTVVDGMTATNHLAVAGLFAIALAFTTFVSTLTLHAVATAADAAATPATKRNGAGHG